MVKMEFPSSRLFFLLLSFTLLATSFAQLSDSDGDSDESATSTPDYDSNVPTDSPIKVIEVIYTEDDVVLVDRQNKTRRSLQSELESLSQTPSRSRSRREIITKKLIKLGILGAIIAKVKNGGGQQQQQYQQQRPVYGPPQPAPRPVYGPAPVRQSNGGGGGKWQKFLSKFNKGDNGGGGNDFGQKWENIFSKFFNKKGKGQSGGQSSYGQQYQPYGNNGGGGGGDKFSEFFSKFGNKGK